MSHSSRLRDQDMTVSHTLNPKKKRKSKRNKAKKTFLIFDIHNTTSKEGCQNGNVIKLR